MSIHALRLFPLGLLSLLVAIGGCASSPREADAGDRRPRRRAAGDSALLTRKLIIVRGFTEPEAVRFDPELDVYFVSNFGEGDETLDNNGFISKMTPDGEVEPLRFIAGGTGGVTLHQPRGMSIVGDTLWVADADAVRGFNRRTGEPVATIDFTAMDVGFLNDIGVGRDGALYVTDTNRNRIYRIAGRAITVAMADSALNRPNGITWDPATARFIVVPFGGSHSIFGWRPGQSTLDTIATTTTGARYDGVEALWTGNLVVASQADTSLYLFMRDTAYVFARPSGRPADIAIDTKRERVAVPFVALNMVEIFALPAP